MKKDHKEQDYCQKKQILIKVSSKVNEAQQCEHNHACGLDLQRFKDSENWLLDILETMNVVLGRTPI